MTYPRLLLVLMWIALLPGVQTTFAQDDATPADADAAYASPRDTLRTFLTAITTVRDQGDFAAWTPALRAMGVASDEAAQPSYEQKRAAEQLLAVFDHVRFVVYEELPGKGDLPAGQREYVFFPRPFNESDAVLARQLELDGPAITLTRDDAGRWHFSNETIADLPELYEAATTRGELKYKKGETVSPLQAYVPRTLITREWLNIMYWQWIALGVLILLGVVLDYIVRAILKVVIAGQVNKRKGEDHGKAIATAARPLGMFAAGVFWLLLLRFLAMPETAQMLLRAAAAVYTILAGTWAAWRVLDLIAEVMVQKAAKTATKLDDILIPLVRKALKIFIAAIGVIYGADALDIPIGPMLASLGIGGLAFAFAAKDTIENFFGSVAVILDRPFEVGDWVVIDGMEGTVEELGFRSTRIRTFYNSQITIPNASLVRASVDNYGRRKYRRWKTTLGVQYDTTPEQLLAFTEGIRELVRTHPYTRKDYYQVWCNDYADSSLNILLYVFFEVPDWNTELRERERLFVDIVRLADQLGVSFAFPTTTVHLFNEEHTPKDQAHEPAHDTPGKTSDRRAFVKGIRAAQKLVKNQGWQDNVPGPQTYGQVGMTELEGEIDPADATENTRAVPEPPQDEGVKSDPA